MASPENGVCANRRPVNGRTAQRPVAPKQAQLVPLAAGHAREGEPPARMPSVASAVVEAASHAPFAADAPEATFSLAQLRELPPTPQVTEAPSVAAIAPAPAPDGRSIRFARAAAAARTPVAEVRIPIAEVEGGSFQTRGTTLAQPALPGMEQLVERVRQRTAARLSRAGSFSPA